MYVQIREALRHRIISGELRPHDQIESEHAISALFNASRVTVRHALKDLEHEGLIFRVHGKGSYVSKPKIMQDITRLRGLAESMRMAGHETLNRVLGLELVPCPAAVAEKLRCAVGVEVVNLRRLRYLNRQPVSLDSTYLPALHLRTLQSVDLNSRDLYDVLQNECEESISFADMSIDARLADAETAAALEIRENDAVLQIVRVARRVDGSPIDCEYVNFRGDSFSYQLRLEKE
jgi:GntR family transcriptional regulator